MKLPFYWVDAFTDKIFHGNPAGICPLDKWPMDEVMQKIAFENGLAETAYYVPENDGFRLRWFTPLMEVDLCGHATLAAAHIAFYERGYPKSIITFHSRSGSLHVAKRDGLLEMDFPSRPAKMCAVPPALARALHAEPTWGGQARDFMAVFSNEAEVRALQPDFEALAKLDLFAVIATAPGDESDFVSRFFAPKAGISEDHVTGSAHCTLVPYWAEQLGKNRLHAFQRSPRGGELWCELAGDRVKIAGKCALYLRGEITV